jgi:hypothetical protein
MPVFCHQQDGREQCPKAQPGGPGQEGITNGKESFWQVFTFNQFLIRKAGSFPGLGSMKFALRPGFEFERSIPDREACADRRAREGAGQLEAAAVLGGSRRGKPDKFIFTRQQVDNLADHSKDLAALTGNQPAKTGFSQALNLAGRRMILGSHEACDGAPPAISAVPHDLFAGGFISGCRPRPERTSRPSPSHPPRGLRPRPRARCRPGPRSGPGRRPGCRPRFRLSSA